MASEHIAGVANVRCYLTSWLHDGKSVGVNSGNGIAERSSERSLDFIFREILILKTKSNDIPFAVVNWFMPLRRAGSESIILFSNGLPMLFQRAKEGKVDCVEEAHMNRLQLFR